MHVTKRAKNVERVRDLFREINFVVNTITIFDNFDLFYIYFRILPKPKHSYDKDPNQSNDELPLLSSGSSRQTSETK